MKIMLLAFERDSYAIGAIARLLENAGHKVWIVNGDHWSFIFDRSVSKWYAPMAGLFAQEIQALTNDIAVFAFHL